MENNVNTDYVNHPVHYCGGIETIDFIKDKLTDDGFVAYCIGNVIKYLSRYDKKGDPVGDLRKAGVYLKWATEALVDAGNKAHEDNRRWGADLEYVGPALKYGDLFAGEFFKLEGDPTNTYLKVDIHRLGGAYKDTAAVQLGTCDTSLIFEDTPVQAVECEVVHK